MRSLLLFSLITLFMLQLLFFVHPFSVNAQFQEEGFSANDQTCSSYRCPTIGGSTPNPSYNSAKEFCECKYTVNGESITQLAYLRPPALQQVEIWFVRILYVVWAFVGSLSFLLLVYLGYQYMLTRGDVTKITYIRQRIINYGIGLILVFLAVPVLTTFFRVLGVNGDVKCYDFDTLPRFQFFFPELCTDPKQVIVSDPCNYPGSANGFACPVVGETTDCILGTDTNGDGKVDLSDAGARQVQYVCTQDRVWQFVDLGHI